MSEYRRVIWLTVAITATLLALIYLASTRLPAPPTVIG